MRETIPTVSAENVDYSILSTDIEHIKPEIIERHDQIHSFDEHFMELSTNQLLLYQPQALHSSAELKEENGYLFTREKHSTELENVISEVFIIRICS